MKTFLKFITAAMVVCSFSFANAQSTDPQNQQPPSPAQTTPSKSTGNYITMKNGKIMEYMNGKETELKGTFVATNGSKVSTSGLITMKDGTTRQMKEGDRFYKDGRLEMAEEKPEKPEYPPK